ncbi:MAG: hypothetical protein AAFX04_10495 [Pseudomonadota bacterium]
MAVIALLIFGPLAITDAARSEDKASGARAVSQVRITKGMRTGKIGEVSGSAIIEQRHVWRHRLERPCPGRGKAGQPQPGAKRCVMIIIDNY